VRTHFLLLTAAVLLSACADDQHTTGPASRSNVSGRSATGDVTAPGQLTPNPQAKPVNQVGFTTVTTVTSATFEALPLVPGYLVATCPAGTTVISGGYEILTGQDDARIYYDGPSGANGWKVKLTVAVGGSSTTYNAFAMCAE
jgi:hypothetical protein